jgi:hypothetical protein
MRAILNSTIFDLTLLMMHLWVHWVINDSLPCNMEIYLKRAPSKQSSNAQSCQKINMISTSWVPFKHLNHKKQIKGHLM